ncbi:hypothetical protein ABLB69_08900 [Xenorhabdus khoisanae]|uniref:hypothetical protein n=1 Tax=Xenorhabdus khoisanae TaxID=880157 RepID=UPI0032B812DD
MATLKSNIENNADLIIGQRFLITITLASDNSIGPDDYIEFKKKSNNVTVPLGHQKLKILPGSDEKIAEYTTFLDVESDVNKISEDDEIIFFIDTNIPNVTSLIFNCTAKKINSDSLPLIIENVLLDTPNTKFDNPILKTKVSTILISKEGFSLSNTPVFITATTPESLTSCKILGSDDTTPLSIQKIGYYSGLFINSDKNGNVIFYIYPQKPESIVLNLVSWIIGVYDPVLAASPIFIVNYEIPNNDETIPGPNILESQSGSLTSDGESNFYASVYHYEQAVRGDYILFFTRNIDKSLMRKYSGYYHVVDNPKKELGLDNFYFSLPYDIFDINVSYELSYDVIMGNPAGSKISSPTSIIYTGGAIYNPPENVKRDYDSCKVYTSLGIGKSEIPVDTIISYDSIKRYLDNLSKPNTGLFVQILGAHNKLGKVPLGYKTTLNIYIESEYRNIQIPMTNRMPTIVDDNGIASLVFHIDFDLVVGIGPYLSGGDGTIYFDYYFNIGGEKHYGKVWGSSINTLPE